MRHEITGVTEGSVAEKHGFLAGDVFISVNGEPVIDEIDYQALSAHSHLAIVLERDGIQRTVSLTKDSCEPLGLRFGDSMVLKPRNCQNQCIFCFIDQMPPNLRSTLYVKDDDWRFSLMMGNYITLTNVTDAEFERMIKRYASPLYISVHTTNPDLRRRMMNNKRAGELLPRLERLKAEGIRFHCQIVCCPGINDGDALMQTLNDLYALTPAVLSVAIVPVGLTKFRSGLPAITPFDARSAQALLMQIEPFQAHCRDTLDTTFVFASDEFYCLSGAAIPPSAWYEDYPQIENGVGMLRQFEEQMREEAEDDEDAEPEGRKTYLIATGVSAAPHIQRMCDTYAPSNATVHVQTIRNHFFGETVTVAGLLTGGDVLDQLSPTLLQNADRLLITAGMLRHEQDLFLDDMTLEEFKRKLPIPVRTVTDGYDLYHALRNR